MGVPSKQRDGINTTFQLLFALSDVLHGIVKNIDTAYTCASCTFLASFLSDSDLTFMIMLPVPTLMNR